MSFLDLPCIGRQVFFLGESSKESSKSMLLSASSCRLINEDIPNPEASCLGPNIDFGRVS